MIRKAPTILLNVILVVLLADIAQADWQQQVKLTPFDASESVTPQFGRSVSISADYAVIGAQYDDEMGDSAGAAYIFERNSSGNWDEAIKLTASDAKAGDSFGHSVSIHGSYAVVGMRCPPKTDPSVVRVSTDLRVRKELSHEKVSARADCAEVAAG